MRLIKQRLAAETGFTMVAAIGALMVTMILSAAAIAAAGGDIHLSRYDQDDKQALAAAEAGVADYLAHLNVDSNYWINCNTPPGSPTPSHGLNQPPVPNTLTGTRPAPRKWRDLPGADSRYSIDLIPKPGKNSCDTADPLGSMIDNDGNLKIRSTGNVTGTDNYRTVVATLRRTGFLDYLYYTDLENQDPSYAKRQYKDIVTRSTDANGNPGGTTYGPQGQVLDWATTACELHWWEGRPNQTWRGQYSFDGGTTFYPQNSSITVPTAGVCGEITFGDQDAQNGPFHSNDNILVCGTPSFGRVGKNDRVEVSDSPPGWRGCDGSKPEFYPSLKTKASQLQPPPNNTKLDQVVDPAYSFVGQTTIALKGTTMDVTNPNVNGGAAQNMPLPGNGVIYVKNNGCASGYNPFDTEALDPGCGDVRLSGNFSKDLTIGAGNDIVVTGNVTRNSASNLLGLVANGFVRVWHPVENNVNSTNTGSDCKNRADSPYNVQIDAAILTLRGSFTTDNYKCGEKPLGNLTVNGAIAQKHRGVVGTGNNGGSSTGYIKNYNYNENLKYRSPPYFLDPVQSAWRVLRQGEQSPPQRN